MVLLDVFCCLSGVLFVGFFSAVTYAIANGKLGGK